MNFLTRTVSWANWQFGVLKVSMLALGIMIGAYLADLLEALSLAGRAHLPCYHDLGHHHVGQGDAEDRISGEP